MEQISQGRKRFAKTAPVPDVVDPDEPKKLRKRPRTAANNSPSAHLKTEPSSSSSSLPTQPHAVGASDEWQRELRNKFIRNAWSAKDVITVAAKAQAAGAQGGELLAKQNGKWSNAARDMLRACLKNCKIPELTFFDCKVKDAAGQISAIQMPCLRPSLVLPSVLAQATEEQTTLWRNHPTRHQDLLQFCHDYNCSPANTYALGMHGDGVPFKAKMQDSIEQFSWSFCSDPASPRFLFCVVPKSSCAGRQTYEDILSEFAADMKRLAQPDMPYNACLIELRGDWAYYNAVFGFPSWSSARICWKCAATQNGHCSFRDTGANAHWRSTRQTGFEFLKQQAANGVPNSAIFAAPGVKVEHVAIDWLHTADIGITQSVFGNSLFECLQFLQGATLNSRAVALWQRLKLHYKEARPPAQFQKLTLDMIRMPGKGPKLRGKAAETRFLMPFVLQLTAEFASRSKHAALVHQVAEHLSNLYMYLDASPFPAELAAAECQLFCDKYLALNLEAEARGRPKHWKMKPKFHLIQELLQYDCLRTQQSPRLSWTYADESWGGVVAKIAARRGGF